MPDTPPPVSRKWTRRAFISFGATAGAGAAVCAYSRHIEPDNFEVHRVALPREFFPAPTGLKILHLTDLHYGRDVPLEMIARAVSLGLAQKPDLIALTGDFISGKLRNAEAYTKVLRPLAEAAPTFACAGNHDGMPGANPRREETDCAGVGAMLESAGIRFLHNKTETVTVRDVRLKVAGLGDLWAGETRPRGCLERASVVAVEDTPVVLLNHNPDARADLMAYRWHLMLSGHTHGGQCGIPFIEKRLAPVKDKSHLEGLREREGRLIHISRGVGNLHGVRFLCRPQVSLLIAG
jgi:predicted MPP superfamily phosphohydrolase